MFVHFDTRGIPLEIILGELKERDYVIDWYDFIMQAVKAKRGIPTTLNQVYDAISDVYDEELAIIVTKKMKKLIKNGDVG